MKILFQPTLFITLLTSLTLSSAQADDFQVVCKTFDKPISIAFYQKESNRESGTLSLENERPVQHSTRFTLKSTHEAGIAFYQNKIKVAEIFIPRFSVSDQNMGGIMRTLGTDTPVTCSSSTVSRSQSCSACCADIDWGRTYCLNACNSTGQCSM